MPMVKVTQGLLEEENYLTSPAADFLGSGARSSTESVFRLYSGEVIRKLPYAAFVIDVWKEPAANGAYEFFIECGGDTAERVGLREEPGDRQAVGWRIIYYDGFVQTYASYDGVTWESKGGKAFTPVGEWRQGFRLLADEALVITNYRVYASPYALLQNFPPGTRARMTDAEGATLERTFNEQHECAFFMDGEREAVVEIFLPDDPSPVYISNTLRFMPGDVFLFTTEHLQIWHNGKALNYLTTHLRERRESFVLRNLGTEPVQDVYIRLDYDGPDALSLSDDDEQWQEYLRVSQLDAGAAYPFTLRFIIHKEAPFVDFHVKQFDLCLY